MAHIAYYSGVIIGSAIPFIIVGCAIYGLHKLLSKGIKK